MIIAILEDSEEANMKIALHFTLRPALFFGQKS